MKPYFFMVLGLLFLVGCNQTTTTQTEVPTQIVATSVPATPAPTATPIRAATLPPVQNLNPAATGENLPTRTLAASITPAPTRTTNLMIAITPEAQETSEAPVTDTQNEPNANTVGPVLQISFNNLTEEIQSREIISTGDSVIFSTMTVIYRDTGPKFEFTAVRNGEPVELAADLIFNFNPEVGNITISFGAVYERNSPANTYSGDLLGALEVELINSLTALIVDEYEEAIGTKGLAFAVTNLTESSAGLTIETTGN